MRTIKFRGKFISDNEFVPHPFEGRWVYGDLMHNAIFHCGKFADAICEEGTFVKVDSETVGQFTGLLDKNGKEIYEGDILKLQGERHKLEVRFVRGVFAFLWEGSLNDEFSCNAPTQEWAEVVGNIYENPELIKKKQL